MNAADTAPKKKKANNDIITEDGSEDNGLKEEVAGFLKDLKNGKVKDDVVDEVMYQKPSFNQWEKANLGDDGANEKFRRLMGLGKKSCAAAASNGQTNSSSAFNSHSSTIADRDEVKKMFSQQEDQYKRALAFGTKRGTGLGFAQAEKKPQNKKITFGDD